MQLLLRAYSAIRFLPQREEVIEMLPIERFHVLVILVDTLYLIDIALVLLFL